MINISPKLHNILGGNTGLNSIASAAGDAFRAITAPVRSVIGSVGSIARGTNRQIDVLSGDYLEMNRALQREAAERQMEYQTSSAREGMAFDAEQAQIHRDWSSAQAERSMAFESEQAQTNRDYQERMRNTEMQARVADLQKAGLNPMLAVTQGGASSPSGAVASGSMGSGTAARGISQAGSKAEVDTINHALDLLQVIASNANTFHSTNMGVVGKVLGALLG